MAVALTGWYVGYVVASAVIVVVVALVGWILSLVRKIHTQVLGISAEVAQIRETTAPVPLVAKVNDKLVAIVDHAATARKALVGE
jgi:hypothetical protein